jgi:sec-independent protein translocase protein TatA
MGLDNPLHLAFLLLVLLLVFGAKRLPEMGRSLGAGMRSFRDSLSGESGSAERGAAQAPQLAAGTPGTALEAPARKSSSVAS